MPVLDTPFARLEHLIRQPQQTDANLQAFDAADEYLLHELHGQQLPPQTRVLILNDSFGALACSLAGHFEVTSSGDSHLAQKALVSNLTQHHGAPTAVRFIPASEPIDGPFDRVLIRVPKTLALLEEQLIRLHGQLAPGAQILAGAMLKHLPRRAGDLLEQYLGPVQASLAVKKARLLRVTPVAKPQPQSPYPSYYTLETPALRLSNQASLFSREGLDIGTRALLPYLPAAQGPQRVADLGCGNGVLGICYALANPEAQLTLVDESYMAVQSAQQNWQAILGARPVQIQAADGLSEQAPQSLERVLCNPPFHQQQTIGDFLAWRMFQQAHRALVVGGDLWIVGNRHLGYHLKLKRLFSRLESVAATPKFVILRAIK